jgi:hypothetical protein
MGGLELVELELPPHDTSVAIAVPQTTTVNAASIDFMSPLLSMVKTINERGGGRVYSGG